MKQETLKKAIELNKELERTFEITKVMEDEKSHWWSFLTPGTKKYDEDGIYFTERIRKKFKEAIEELNVELKKEIEAL